MSQRIRITAKYRDEIDIDKLAAALLRLAKQLTESQPPAAPNQGTAAETGNEPKPQEPAA